MTILASPLFQWRPWEIARVTDWQVAEVYARPFLEWVAHLTGAEVDAPGDPAAPPLERLAAKVGPAEADRVWKAYQELKVANWRHTPGK